jgi:hypothetical protein
LRKRKRKRRVLRQKQRLRSKKLVGPRKPQKLKLEHAVPLRAKLLR